MKKQRKPTTSQIYAEYLCAHAVVRSGGRLEDLVEIDEHLMAARALGANDGHDREYMPAFKWAVLEQVEELLHKERRDKQPCKVVAMGSETEVQ